MKFKIKRDAAGEYRWTLYANNGEPIADSNEGYSSKESCKHGIELVQQCAHADIEDMS